MEQLIQVKCGTCTTSPSAEETEALPRKFKVNLGNITRTHLKNYHKTELNNNSNKSHIGMVTCHFLSSEGNSKYLAIFPSWLPITIYHLLNTSETKHKASLTPTCPQPSCKFLYIYVTCLSILSFIHSLINASYICLEICVGN